MTCMFHLYLGYINAIPELYFMWVFCASAVHYLCYLITNNLYLYNERYLLNLVEV